MRKWLFKGKLRGLQWIFYHFILLRDEVGTIKYFVLCNDIVYAVIQTMRKIPNLQIPGVRIAHHYITVDLTDHVSIVEVSDLREVLVYLDTRDNENVPCNPANYPQVVYMPNKFGHAEFK